MPLADRATSDSVALTMQNAPKHEVDENGRDIITNAENKLKEELDRLRRLWHLTAIARASQYGSGEISIDELEHPLGSD